MPAVLRSTGARSRPLTAWEIRVGFPEEVTFDLALKDESELTGGRRAELSLARGRVGSGSQSAAPRGRQVLMDWINAELLPEHIVVRSLEEDIFDGLILHHLFRKLPLPAPGRPGRGAGWASLGLTWPSLQSSWQMAAGEAHRPRLPEPLPQSRCC